MAIGRRFSLYAPPNPLPDYRKGESDKKLGGDRIRDGDAFFCEHNRI